MTFKSIVFDIDFRFYAWVIVQYWFVAQIKWPHTTHTYSFTMYNWICHYHIILHLILLNIVYIIKFTVCIIYFHYKLGVEIMEANQDSRNIYPSLKNVCECLAPIFVDWSLDTICIRWYVSYCRFHCEHRHHDDVIIAGTLGYVFIDNETHESGVTKCTTGEAWSAFSGHH